MGFSKRDIFLMIALSQTKTVSTLLRMKDDNDTGSDDIAADIVDFTVDCIQAVQRGVQLPMMPASLAQALRLQPAVNEVDEPDSDSALLSSAKIDETA